MPNNYNLQLVVILCINLALFHKIPSNIFQGVFPSTYVHLKDAVVERRGYVYESYLITQVV